MEYAGFIEFINGVGFPIAVTIALFYQNLKQDERYDNQMKEITKVVNNNTVTLSELCGKLEREYKNGENR